MNPAISRFELPAEAPGAAEDRGELGSWLGFFATFADTDPAVVAAASGAADPAAEDLGIVPPPRGQRIGSQTR